MKSVVVVLRLDPSETHRFCEAVRLCSGLAAGGLEVAALFESQAVRALDECARVDQERAPVAEALGLLSQVGLRLKYDADAARACGVRVERSLAADALTASRMREIFAQAQGRIVFDPRDEAEPAAPAGVIGTKAGS